jgi:hypothetical protein
MLNNHQSCHCYLRIKILYRCFLRRLTSGHAANQVNYDPFCILKVNIDMVGRDRLLSGRQIRSILTYCTFLVYGPGLKSNIMTMVFLGLILTWLEESYFYQGGPCEVKFDLLFIFLSNWSLTRRCTVHKFAFMHVNFNLQCYSKG